MSIKITLDDLLEKAIENLAISNLNNDCKEIVEMLSRKLGEKNIEVDLDAYDANATMEISISSPIATGSISINMEMSDKELAHYDEYKRLKEAEFQLEKLNELLHKAGNSRVRITSQAKKIKGLMVSKLADRHAKKGWKLAQELVESSLSELEIGE
jgi:hypothetical protein